MDLSFVLIGFSVCNFFMRPNILRSFGWLKPGFIAFNKDLVGFFTPLLVGNRLCLRGWRVLACIVWWLNHCQWFYKMAMPGKCSSLSSVCYWDWSNFIHPWWSKFIQYFWLISSSNPVWSTLAILDSSTESNKSASFDRGWCWFLLDEFGDSVSNPFDGLSVLLTNHYLLVGVGISESDWF